MLKSSMLADYIWPWSSRKDGEVPSHYYKVGVEVQAPHAASIDTSDGAAPCCF